MHQRNALSSLLAFVLLLGTSNIFLLSNRLKYDLDDGPASLTKRERDGPRAIFAFTDADVSSQPPLDILLRHEWDSLVSGQNEDAVICDVYMGDMSSESIVPVRQRFLTNLIPRTCADDRRETSITIATHLGVGKLDRLVTQARMWGIGGPISASLYLSSRSDVEQFAAFWADQGGRLCSVSIHVLMEYVQEDLSKNITLALIGYPHNFLRDMSLQQVRSNYFLTADADFVTLQDGHRQVSELLKGDQGLSQALRNNTLLVLPAFEFTRSHDALPATRNDVIGMTRRFIGSQADGELLLVPFHHRLFPPGHGPTNYPKWLSLDEKDPNQAWYDIDYRFRFEPFVLGYTDRSSVRRYWTEFRAVHNDKTSWIMEMHCHGYKFRVLRDMVVLHLHHPIFQSRKMLFRKRMSEVFDRFRAHIRSRYPQCNKQIKQSK